MEECKGCGAKADQHPFVGIGRADMDNDTGEMVSYPVCRLCHADPEHRRFKLKCHFHPRTSALLGLAAARVTDELSRSGQDISLGGQ